MQSGRLREYVQFERRVISGDTNAGQVISWTAAFSTWAHPERLSELNCRFTVRYRAGITPASHRIIWEGVLWTIIDAVHDLKRRELVIECAFSNLIDVTHMTSTEAEFIDAIPILRPRE